MISPYVSVIIPAYNVEQFLGEAIQSVLDQTYQSFEVIVVNDASTDNTDKIIQSFRDPRLKYFTHKRNRGLPATRNRGIRWSTGEIIALLDADDVYHPEKLRYHVDFLQENSEVGVSYNPRFDVIDSCDIVQALWWPPSRVELSDLVLGFPFSPSDMVIRREWALQVGLFDESDEVNPGSEDLDINCRLALAGCKFASVNKALNYRRFHSGRVTKNLTLRKEAALRTLDRVFSDPHCPNAVRGLRELASAQVYLDYTYYALVQREGELGKECILELIKLTPSLLNGNPCRLLELLLHKSILFDREDHKNLLERIFAQLPSEVAWLSEQKNSALGLGYLLKGARAVIWGRLDEGNSFFDQANCLGTSADDRFVKWLAAQILDFEIEFGNKKALNVLEELLSSLRSVGYRSSARKLIGYLSMNRAFVSYKRQEYREALSDIVSALWNEPKFFRNRGVLSVLIHSIFSTGPIEHTQLEGFKPGKISNVKEINQLSRRED